MQFTEINGTFVLRLEQGEEIIKTITDFIKEQNIETGIISGIGAASDAVLLYFNMEMKEYQEKSFPGTYEILALNGNISLKEGKPWPHLHVVLGAKDYQCIGGHLKSGTVGATCEVFIRKLDMRLKRNYDEETGLHFLAL